MDTERFDAWTRRRFGRVAAGGLAALLGGLARDGTDARRKAARRRKRKRRCLSQPNRVWCGGRCVAGECCPGNPCGDAPNCQCMRSIGGPAVCVQRTLFDCETTCADAATCPRDERCVHLGQPCEGFTTCLPACGAG